MKTKNEYKKMRRRYIVNKPFQYRYILRMLAHQIAAAAFAGLFGVFLVVYVFHSTAVSAGVWRNVVAAGSVIMLTLIFLTATLRGVYLSHRIAGPMKRFEMAFGKVKNGDFSIRIELRNKDEMHDLAGAFNKMMDELDSRNSLILDYMAKAKKKAEDGDKEGCVRLIGEAEALIEKTE